MPKKNKKTAQKPWHRHVRDKVERLMKGDGDKKDDEEKKKIRDEKRQLRWKKRQEKKRIQQEEIDELLMKNNEWKKGVRGEEGRVKRISFMEIVREEMEERERKEKEEEIKGKAQVPVPGRQ